ncbi:hypothetical protein O3M35_012385 [Rhynocoris fuscipes]|uniref:RNase H type-1 domain-containing protein n=1 Tax=Rhynocoris fuscipes TaxID=488301 RepID=A0AAW1CSY1_9HEMI
MVSIFSLGCIHKLRGIPRHTSTLTSNSGDSVGYGRETYTSHAGIEGNERVDDLAKQGKETGLEVEVKLDEKMI